jgi:hypothetical protein
MLTNTRIDHSLSLLTVARTLKMYLRHPARSIRWEKHEIEQFFAGKKLERLGFTNYFARKKMPVGAFAPEWSDLLNIYELIRRLKPRTILEIGSGCSTLMYAQGLHDNATLDGVALDGKIYSLDASEYWLDATMKYVPDHLHSYIQTSTITSKLIEYEGLEVSVVEPYPISDIDFLYVDGGLHEDNKLGADALFLEQISSTPFTILVDGRGPTWRFLEKHLKNDYNMTYSKSQYWTLFEPKH